MYTTSGSLHLHSPGKYSGTLLLLVLAQDQSLLSNTNTEAKQSALLKIKLLAYPSHILVPTGRSLSAWAVLQQQLSCTGKYAHTANQFVHACLIIAVQSVVLSGLFVCSDSSHTCRHKLHIHTKYNLSLINTSNEIENKTKHWPK